MGLLNETELDKIGQIADDLDAATFAATLKLPAETHIGCLVSSIEKARDALKAFVRERGFDPWAEDEETPDG